MGRSHAQGVWTVVSGSDACELSRDGLCVSDGDGDYRNDESCTVRAEVAIVVSVQINPAWCHDSTICIYCSRCMASDLPTYFSNNAIFDS